MKYQYKKYGKTDKGELIIRPIIPITLHYGDRSIRYEVLVDSGADMCVFDAEIAHLLGIDLTSGQSDTFSGVTGIKSNSYNHAIKIEVGGHIFDSVAAFAPGISRFGHGIVGQAGFFEFLKITFDHTEREIDLKIKKAANAAF